MSRASSSLSLFVVTVAMAGCTEQPDIVTAEDGAAYLGLEAGTTLTYAAGDGLTETHERKPSDVLFAGGLTVDVIARQNGFANDERTLTFGIDVQQVSIVRFFDCLSRCAQPDQPIAFLNWPLETGDTVVGEGVVSDLRNGETTARNERHTTTVGASQSVTVPAGTFDAFPITWQRTTADAAGTETTDSAVLYLAPDTGVVKHEAFDGTTLELTDGAEP
jgi:hypothetical protein